MRTEPIPKLKTKQKKVRKSLLSDFDLDSAMVDFSGGAFGEKLGTELPVSGLVDQKSETSQRKVEEKSEIGTLHSDTDNSSSEIENAAVSLQAGGDANLPSGDSPTLSESGVLEKSEKIQREVGEKPEIDLATPQGLVGGLETASPAMMHQDAPGAASASDSAPTLGKAIIFEKPETSQREVEEISEGSQRKVGDNEYVQDKVGGKPEESRRPEPLDEILFKSEESQREVGDISEVTRREAREKSEKSQRPGTEINGDLRENSKTTQGKVGGKAGDKVGEKSRMVTEDFDSLVSLNLFRGKQRIVLIHLFQKAIEHGGRENRVAYHVTKPELGQVANASPDAGKDIAKQLLEKSAIKIFDIVDGRGGWTDYIIAKNLHRDLLELRASGKLVEESQRQVGDKARDKAREFPSSSSSSLNIAVSEEENFRKTTTTEDTAEEYSSTQQLPLDWQHIDISSGLEIKFGIKQLHQVFTANLLIKNPDLRITPQEIEESLKYIVFDITYNKKTFGTGSLNMLMGLLRKGTPYSRPATYKSRQEMALEKRLADRKAESDRRWKLEQELYKFEVQAWIDGLTDDEKRSISPEAHEGVVQRGNFLNHFDAVLWPRIRAEALGLNKSDQPRSDERNTNGTQFDARPQDTELPPVPADELAECIAAAEASLASAPTPTPLPETPSV